MQWRQAVLTGLLLTLVAGCAGGTRGLQRVEPAGNGPDEFAVLPALPISIPETLDLPPPTPGGANRTDRDPLAEASVALGGDAVVTRGGDAGLFAALAPFGTDPAIRTTLASEDAAFRRRAGAIGFGGNAAVRYLRAYAPFALDAQAELLRWRNAGAGVPSAQSAE